MTLGPSFLVGLKPRIIDCYRHAAPEKAKQIAEIEKRLDNVDLDDRADSFGALTTYGVITGSWWALEALWCFAFAVARLAPKFEDAIQNHVREVPLTDVEDQLALTLIQWALPTLAERERRAWPHIEMKWPYDERGGINSDELRAAETVFLHACSWILFHELSHVHREHGSRQQDNWEMEYEADADATRWLITRAEIGQAAERGLGLVCALFLMLVRESQSESADADHPPMGNRIRKCIEAAGFHDNAPPVGILATMIETFAQYRKVMTPGVSESSPGLRGETFSTDRAYLEALLVP